MKSITQKAKYRQTVVKFSTKYGVSKASRKFNEHRKTIYRWRERYDGTVKSLEERSRKPKHHPNEHTEEEIQLIKRYKSNNKKTGLVVLWVKLRKEGYTRTISGLYIVMKRIGIYEKTPSKRKEYIAKEYEQMKYPGERVQIDVKYVPTKCLTPELRQRNEKYYQYTAIDEYSRVRYLYFSNEHSTYESTKFVERLVNVFPFKIECIQTDNGFEFTNRLSWNLGTRDKKTMFENKLKELNIRHKLIKPHTPRHNGKVERSHRKDQERFYYEKIFHSLEDLKSRAKYWIKEYNNFPMRPLGWLSPKEKLEEYMCKVK